MADIPSYLTPNAPAAPQTQQAPASTDLSAGGPAEQVLDVENNTPLNIPHSEFEIAVRSGQYAPVADKEYVVKDAQGETHRVKGTNLKTVLDQGSTFAAPEEAHKHMVQAKYGDSEILAGAEGVARGVLPWVSDTALKAMGVSQEDLAGRAEANPISAGVGEAVGTIVSPVGKLAMAKGALVAGKTAAGLTKIATKAGLTNKVAQAIVSKIIPAAAGSAVEGAFFGAAHLVNEDALGTAQFNAENLLSSVEQGALWGAAFGGGLSALGSATSSTAHALAESRAGKYIATKVDDFGTSINNKQKATYEFLGITPAKARKLADRDPEFIEDALKWTSEVLEQNPRAGVAEVAAKATDDLADVGRQVGKLYDDVDAITAAKGYRPTVSAKELKQKIAQELDEKIMPKFDNVAGMDAEIKSVHKVINEIFDGASNEGIYNQLSTKELHRAMRNVQEKINFEKAMAPAGPTLKQEMLLLQREVIRKELDNAVAIAAKEFPQELSGAAETLKGLNRRYRTITSLEKAVNARAFGEANESVLKGLVDTKDMLAASIDPTLGAAMVVGKKFIESDMLRKMQILGKIEKAQLKTKAAIQTSLSAIGKGARSSEPLVAQSLVASAVATELVDGKRKKPQDEQQAYRNITANARFAAENPEQFLQGVNRYSAHLYAVAPNTSGALDTAALNAMVFLHSKAKVSTKQKGFFDSKKLEKVNGADLLKMQQRMDMIQNPTKAIKLLQNGKLGATHVETIKAVYPALYSEMQTQTMEFLSSSKAEKLTYSQKLNMSMLLDVKADESMHFENVMALQSNFASEDESGAAQGVVNPTQGGLAKMDKSSRLDNDPTNDDV